MSIYARLGARLRPHRGTLVKGLETASKEHLKDRIKSTVVDPTVQTVTGNEGMMKTKKSGVEAISQFKAHALTRADRHMTTNELFRSSRITRNIDRGMVEALFSTTPDSYMRAQSLQKEAAIPAIVAGGKALATKVAPALRGLGKKALHASGQASAVQPMFSGQPKMASIAPRVNEFFEKKAYLPEAYRKFPELLKESATHLPRPAISKDPKQREKSGLTHSQSEATKGSV